MAAEAIQPRGVLDRAKKDAERDASLAEEAFAAADLQALHKMVNRLLADRTDLAQGIDAMGRAFVTLREDPAEQRMNLEAIQSVERIAKDAMDFAREVFRLLYQAPASPRSSDAVDPHA